MSRETIPLDKLEEVLDSLFGISDGEDSEDGLESDEDDIDTNFTPPSNQELISVLESETSSGTQSLSITANDSEVPSTSSQYQNKNNTPNIIDPDDSDTTLNVLQARNAPGPVSDDTDDESDDELWKKVPFSHEVPLENFDKNPLQPASFISNRSSPIDYFNLVFTEEIMQEIVYQTNLYASQQNARDWDPVTVTEMQAFIGMLILMGVHRLANIRLYWSTDPLFRVVEIADVMTNRRFEKIMKHMHLNDNTKMPKKGEPGFDKLYKIRPLLESTKALFQKAAVVTNSHSIDECMIKFKGRSTLKQYMPMKPVKRGFKVWARCDSETGYVYEFDVYTGKKEGVTEKGLRASVVKNLCQALIDENIPNIHVAFDNYFSSYDLLNFLYCHKIFATATVRADRKNLPNMIRCERRKKIKLDKGKHKWRVNGVIGFFVWMDTKLVHILSSAYCPSHTTMCKRTQKDATKKEISCPLGVVQYTKRMGGVDRFDQKRGVYPVARKSRRWWLRIFYFLIDAAITNAHILHMTNPRVHMPMKNLQFRTLLGRNLINSFTSRKRRISDLPSFVTKKPKNISRQKAIYGIPNELRLSDVGTHMPGPLPAYRRCRFCSSTNNNKKSKIQCTRCQIPLCIIPCFASFHMPYVGAVHILDTVFFLRI